MINTSPSTNRAIIQSGIAVVAATLCVSWLQIRPLGVFFLSLFLFWFYKTQCNIRVLPPPELHSKFSAFTERVRELRRSNPTSFCIISSVALGALAIFGHLMSGSSVVLMGLILAALVSTRYNFKIVKLDTKAFDWSAKFLDADVDEFLPEMDESTLFVLERASNQAIVSSPTEEEPDEKSDELPTEHLIPDSIPEFDENSSESSDEDILVKPAAPLTEDASKIEFKRGHFKKDSSISTSSSSDEEQLSKGLSLPDHRTVVDSSAMSQSHYLPSSRKAQPMLTTSSILPSLMSGIVSWSMNNADLDTSSTRSAPLTKTIAESSDDSDFEMVDSDELK